VLIAGIKGDKPGDEDENKERKHKEGEKKNSLFLHHLFRWDEKIFSYPF
jgi:hypothetical protein